MIFSFDERTVFVAVLVFARIAAMISVLPAFGEVFVPVRVKSAMAAAIVIVLFPVVSEGYPSAVPSFPGLIALLALELAIGLMIGMSARIVMSCLHTLGTIIAMQSGLSFVAAFDPAQGIQSTLISSFLSIAALTFILVSDLHHAMLYAMRDSYRLFVPGVGFSTADSALTAIRAIADGFRLAVQLAAPFIVFGIVFQAGLAVLGRLIPQVQLFFIAMPAGIYAGLGLLMILLAALLTRFADHLAGHLAVFAPTAPL